MTVRKYAGAAAPTSLSAGMTEADLVGSVLSQQGWPTTTPFFLVIDREKSNEEKCLVTEVNGFSR